MEQAALAVLAELREAQVVQEAQGAGVNLDLLVLLERAEVLELGVHPVLAELAESLDRQVQAGFLDLVVRAERTASQERAVLAVLAESEQTVLLVLADSRVQAVLPEWMDPAVQAVHLEQTVLQEHLEQTVHPEPADRLAQAELTEVAEQAESMVLADRADLV